ncbi:hypothetical protein HGI30_04895 [Paenibacillus albicereus]|uniref:Uncharacterized protein n=1 Tax=Paenibacillus albicereus TaxID=2726185 RepID=A0A6H2GU55_9BACL|nr:hypothetical protein [Paenibacillus albicereus]QJC50963.1 hypothetical protein HGI30_04895 [Paenibacillus albicereus]
MQEDETKVRAGEAAGQGVKENSQELPGGEEAAEKFERQNEEAGDREPASERNPAAERGQNERRVQRHEAERRMKAELLSYLAALFLAPLAASVGISLFLLEPGVLIPVLLFSWIGTLCVAVPVSWMVGRIVGKGGGPARAALAVLLHGVLGGGLVLAFVVLAQPNALGSLYRDGFALVFVLSGAANGFAYGLIRLACRSLLLGR